VFGAACRAVLQAGALALGIGLGAAGGSVGAGISVGTGGGSSQEVIDNFAYGLNSRNRRPGYAIQLDIMDGENVTRRSVLLVQILVIIAASSLVWILSKRIEPPLIVLFIAVVSVVGVRLMMRGIKKRDG